MHDADLRIRAGELVDDVGGRIRAAVVDDDDLVVWRQLRRGFDGADHHAGNGSAVVEGREEDAQARGRRACGIWHENERSKHSMKRALRASGGEAEVDDVAVL